MSQPPVSPAAVSPSPASEPSPSVMAVKNQVEKILGPSAVFEISGKLPAFRVAASEVHAACQKLKAAGFDFLLFVTAVDYPAQTRFELNYALSNYREGTEVCLVADVNRLEPQIETVSDLWLTADWHEREVFDMFGIRFDKHPDLRRILLDDSWTGYPLRKDYSDSVHEVIKRPY
jgi:NADH-quinone oxidoreductase subunit C